MRNYSITIDNYWICGEFEMFEKAEWDNSGEGFVNEEFECEQISVFRLQVLLRLTSTS